jgi:amino acid adenylation domain-containing protein/non-ribosomal peptide synthase protein (TIGR01720 family)
VLVGVCMERSIDMIIAILAIWKAGGAYLPLDPAYPIDRLAYMLEDSQIQVLLSHSSLEAKLPPHRAQVLCLDLLSEQLARYASENLEPTATPDSLAYVIYTSGSTGRPKGTMLEHRGLSNLTEAQVRTFELGPNDNVLQFASPSFDASVFEIVMALRVGAALHLASREDLLPGPTLIKLLNDHKISIVTLPPSVLAALPDQEFPHLRQIIVAGEACSPDLVDRWAPGRRFFNAYGPTETTVWATVEQCDGSDARPPIGRPLINTTIYLFDEQGQLAPIGEPGEIYIGGVGLARGYLGRPELTAERFVVNPFAEADKPHTARLYRTGDLGRFLPDGRIEFLGRIDHQVKLRGFRIELGEIEAVLSRHPAVQEGVVVLREDVPGQKRLVAYVVPNSVGKNSNGSLSGGLRQYLAAQLPDYMVPPVYVMLDAMPLTPNSKVDRKALPAPDTQQVERSGDFVAPRSPNEELLAQIWCDVLQLDQVSITDNFFELGGDSILSIQIISRAHQAGLQISVSQFFQYPTIAELAAVAVSSQGIQAEQGPVVGPVRLTPVQSWFFEQNFAEPHHWNQAMLLELPPMLNVAALEESINALITHHDALRLYFTRTEDGWQQFNAPADAYLAFSIQDLSALPEDEQRPTLERIAAEVQGSLDLAQPPRLRAVLFQLGAQRAARLLIVINYPAIDGVSWRILLEDLQTAYLQASQNRPIALPEKTTSYRQWSERLHEYAKTPTVREEVAFWQRTVRAGDALPIDMPGGDNSEASGRVVKRSLNAEETRALLQDVPKAYRTQINDILLSALAIAFERWKGIKDLLISLESHGREDVFEDVSLSRTVGWFTSCFPLLLHTEPNEHCADTLVRTKEQLRQLPQHGLGYWLLRYLSDDDAIKAQLRALPQPKVRFNYLGQFDQVVSGSSIFRRARESYGPTRSLKGHRDHELVFEGLIAEGLLHFEVTYSAQLHHQANIEALADHYIRALRELIAHCLEPDAGRFTPSDFPLAHLNEHTLRLVAEQIARLDTLEGI